MAMKFDDYLTRIINDGIASAKSDPNLRAHPQRLRGAIAGFEACRGKNLIELHKLLTEAHAATFDKYTHTQDEDANIEDYWEVVNRELQIEWVCNCVSAAVAAMGLQPITTPTARGYIKASEVLGVGPVDEPS
jgi:hypothetical protein